MDLHGITSVARPRSRAELPAWHPGSVILGGGTWIFSEPQPAMRTLVDLGGLAWPALEVSDAGLRIAATCNIVTLEAFAAPPEWTGAALFPQCARSLLGSFKIWNMATVGGNVCLTLPAAPMLALTVALDGVAEVWRPDGTAHSVPMAAFATGPQRNVLQPGEVLRAIDLPAASLRRRAAARQASLTAEGRSAALLAVTLDTTGRFALTVTGSLPRPAHRAWPTPPSAAELDGYVDGLGPWYDDVHGAPAWRRHMTRRLAAALHKELLG